jgi:RNA polymerase sigma-70 factor, ECF subfamily
MQNRHECAAEDPTLVSLMAQYQAGSVEAFDRLHDALAQDLKAYVTKLSRDPGCADDLVQETFLQMHRSRAAHSPGEPVRPWLFAIAKRVFLMYRRSAARRARHEGLSFAAHEATSGAATEAERLHAFQQVHLALRHVPSAGRRAFVLHHLWGLSFREVGARLGVNPAAAKVRSSRAANFMRTLLRGSGNE